MQQKLLALFPLALAAGVRADDLTGTWIFEKEVDTRTDLLATAGEGASTPYAGRYLLDRKER